MSRTIRIENYSFIYNSDFSGDIEIRKFRETQVEGIGEVLRVEQTMEIPGKILLQFAERMRNAEISNQENVSS